MFMRLSGSGIGHKVTDHLQQRTPTGVHNEVPDPHDEILNPHDEVPDPHDEVPDPHNEAIIPYNTQDHTQAGDDDGGEDPEEVDSDEEADYGYVDSPKSKDEDGEGEDGKSEDGKGKEDTDADTGDDEVL